MRVSRIPLIVALPAAFVLLTLPGTGRALDLAAPAPWCLRWTDNCTTCERPRDQDAVKCSERAARPGARQRACIAGKIRCVMAASGLLNAACEKAQTIREACNSCSPPVPGRPQMCTLKLCAVKDIVCVKPRS